MKNFFVCLFLISGMLDAQSPKLDWVQQLGGASSESARRVAFDNYSNVYTAGEFSGTMDADPGPGVHPLTASGNDVFVVKLDASGNLVWARSFGGSNYETLNSLVIDKDGDVIVAGEFASADADFDPGAGTYTLGAANQDGYIVKLTGAGNFVWAAQLKASYQSYVHDLATDTTGAVYAAGHFVDTVDFDPGPAQHTAITPPNSPDMFIWKLTDGGLLDTVFHMSGQGFEVARNIDVDATGSIFLSGDWRDTANFSPGPVAHTLAAIGSRDAFMARYTSTGQLTWVRQVGGSAYANAYSQAIDSASNVHILGGFFGSVDANPGPGTQIFSGSGTLGINEIFILKLDAAGNYLWASQLGDPGGNDYSESIAVDSKGNVYTAGEFDGTSTPDMDPGPGTYTLSNTKGDQNIFAVQLKSDGSFGWAFMVGNEGHNYAYGVAHDGQHLYISGAFNDNNLDFAPGSSTYTLSSTFKDAFVMKLSPECALTSSVIVSGSNLTAMPANAGYQWYDCALGSIIYQETSQTYSPPGNGSYAVIVSQGGCTDTSDCVPFTKTGISEWNGGGSFEMFPNPASGMVTLKIPQLAHGEQAVLSIYSSTGQWLYSMVINDSETRLDLRSTSAGIYQCTLTREDGIQVTRLVLDH